MKLFHGRRAGCNTHPRAHRQIAIRPGIALDAFASCPIDKTLAFGYTHSLSPPPHMVRSMIAETISPSFDLSALTALPRDTPAWVITSSMSLGSTPVSSISPSSSSSIVAADAGSKEGMSALLNCSAAAAWDAALRSSIFASPKMTCVSLFGDLNTSGFETTNRMFLDFLIVTRMTPGTGFIPSFSIALRLFFSLRLCLGLPSSPSSSSSSSSSSSETSSSSTSSTVGSCSLVAAIMFKSMSAWLVRRAA
mmetsp:Transcript_9148/g.33417  ORF Transcript_9148/g.33417 Transcript_9148/m.33417 type:complete len:250 (+) Transcript_9148:310-1059(+)